MLTIIASIIVLGIMILIHEFGHYIAAKALGVGVEAFSIGLGPAILSIKSKSGTVFRISAIPFGGFVKLKGEELEKEEPRKESPREGDPEGEEDKSKPLSDSESAEDEASFTEESHEVPGKNFSSLSYAGKIVVFLSGPLANLVLGYAFFLGMELMGRETFLPVVGEVKEDMPAYGVLKKGDRILEINGEKVEFWEDISPIIQKEAKKGESIKLKIERITGEKRTVLTVKLRPRYIEKYKRYIIGISPVPKTVVVKSSFPESMNYALKDLIRAILLLLMATGLLVKGKLPASDVAGPVGMVYTMSKFSKTLRDFLALSGLISANLAFVNLLPIPGLDGGQIVLTTVDQIYRKVKGKSMPEGVKNFINFLGFAFLMGLLVLATANDVFKLFIKK